MIQVTLTVDKKKVYDEVAKTSAYTGSKMVDDANAYQRIFTTDEDRLLLERFWVEACAGATERMKQLVVSVSSQPESHGVDLTRDYEVSLELSGMYDENMTDSVETSLFSYFVYLITAKWFKLSNKPEAESYGLEAAGMLDDVMRKLFHRKKPIRVTPT